MKDFRIDDIELDILALLKKCQNRRNLAKKRAAQMRILNQWDMYEHYLEKHSIIRDIENDLQGILWAEIKIFNKMEADFDKLMTK